MASVRNLIEAFLGRTLLSSLRGRDQKLFIKSSAFTSTPTPLLHVTAPECTNADEGLHGSDQKKGLRYPSLLIEHTPLSENRFPELKWEWTREDVLLPALKPASADTEGGSSKAVKLENGGQAAAVAAAVVAEYLLIVEDPDAPLPSPVVHGIYYNIPGNKMSLVPADLDLANVERPLVSGGNLLRGGFKYGANRMKSIWGGPRPVLEHGPHRYFFQVVALNSSLDAAKLGPVPTKAEIEKEIVGKVIGWGIWIGSFERRLKR